MSIGFGLLKSVLHNGADSFISLSDNGISLDVFHGDERLVFSMVEQFYLTYGELPSIETIEVSSGVRVPWDSFPIEPIRYWTDQIKDREMLLRAGSFIAQAQTAIGLRDLERLRSHIQQAYIDLEEGINDHSVQSIEEASRLVLEQHNLVQQNYDLPGIPFAFPYLNQISGGMWEGDIISLIGRPGCIAGDTRLYFARKGDKGSGRWYTIEEAYYKFNKIPRDNGRNGTQYLWAKDIKTKTQCLKEDGLTGLSEIDRIVYSGKKELFLVTTETGKVIRITKEHPFKVPDGTDGADKDGFKQLQFLNIGDSVICKAPKYRVKVKQKRKERKTICGVRYHPNAERRIIKEKPYFRIRYARLVYEAKLNGMMIDEFINILKEKEEIASTLKYPPPNVEVHHKDNNSLNDIPENLDALTKAEHTRIGTTRKRLGLNIVQKEKILSIEEYGIEDTYDIVMKEPYRNYVANGFVVHNSGKSYIILNEAIYAHNMGKKVLFVSMEMPNLQCARRILSLRARVNYTRLRLGRVSSFGIQRLESEIEGMSLQPPFRLLSGGIFGSIDRIYAQIKHYRPDIVYIDGAYLIRTTSKGGQRWERVLQVLELLKKLALSENIPIYITFQFNKTAPGTLEGIAFSDGVSQLSSLAISLGTEGTDNASMSSPIQYRTLKVLKGREGETGEIRIELDFDRMVFSQNAVIAGMSDDFEFEDSESSFGNGEDNEPISFI